MKGYFRAAVLAALLVPWAWAHAQKVPPACADMVAAIGVPKYKGDTPEFVVLCRLGYVLAHNNDRKTPDWAVERLTADRFHGPGDRDELGNPFAPDPDLKPGKRAELADYKGSGFDRGHMAPAASMKFSEKATIESFYLSNMSPQVGVGLNRDIWADLEGFTRDWACERGEVIVITGPIYEKDEPDAIGAVAVPTAFYKIAYDPKKKRAIAFVLPNKKIDRKGKKSEAVLPKYIVTVTEVEELTGLHFLDKIPARDRRRIEGLKSVMWSTKKKCPKDQS
jgi:endonuclease G